MRIFINIKTISKSFHPPFSNASSTLPLFSCLRSYSIRYTKNHEWIKPCSNPSESSKLYAVGISEYAQKSLGEVVFVELPQLNQHVKREEPVGCTESVKAASDLYSPASGKVVEINEQIIEKPKLINLKAESIETDDESELNELMDKKQYDELTKENQV